MAEVFVDTSAWYAVVSATHADHATVWSALEDSLRAGKRLVTSNLVVAETHALLTQRAGQDRAMAFVRATTDPSTVVVYSTEELEHVAMTDWLARFKDEDFSLTDAVSFAVMKRRGITRAVTLDRHFAIVGFECAPALTSIPAIATPAAKARRRR